MIRLTPEREKEIVKITNNIARYSHDRIVIALLDYKAEIDALRFELAITKGQKDDESGVLSLVAEEREELRTENAKLTAENTLLTLANDEIGYAMEARVYKKKFEESEKRREKLRETLKHVEDFCLCDRNTVGFDYGELHPHMGKPKMGSRWLTPYDVAKEVLAQDKKEGI